MLLYMIRHGETDQNKEKRLQGRSDIELNAYGRELAQITAGALQKVAFDRIYTSPLKRAKETAYILKGDRQIPIIIEKRIQEISFGEYEGHCYKKENYDIPDPDFNFFFTAPEKYRPAPSGESFEAIIARTGAFLKELVSNPDLQDQTVLLSTHGCALKALLANITHCPLSDFWGTGVYKNCGVAIVEIQNGKMRLLEDGKLYYPLP
ncbi:MAG: histidine phosphatase family protein [Lachnospiraceae bacterium]|nr:histidine phosphatase family protein [Lachnospiraceae bacterium]